jgi:preprotein translocase subunit SecA
MSDLYGSDITADELRDEVDLERQAIVDEFREDALDAYRDKEESFGSEIMREIERYVMLQVVDTRWREHLENMDYLREGVHLRSMAQKDPLVEYTAEGHAMFEELNVAIREEVVTVLFHAELAPEDAAALELGQDGQNGDARGYAYEHHSLAGADAIAAAGALENGGGTGSVSTAGVFGGGGTAVATATQRVTSDREKLGRNDPCWCGSGKKFKKCHGA